MRRTSWGDRLRYGFDNYMARGTIALIAGLGALSLVVILLAAILVVLVRAAPAGEQPLSFLDAAWASLMRTMDAGTMGGDTGWAFRIVMFAVTLGGVFIISTLIGVLTSGIEAKMEHLRKGRSRVIEVGHTVIMGWSPQIFSILSELVEANANRRRACIAILGDRDKVEMEEEIRSAVPDTKGTRIVCRSGSPISIIDVGLTSPQTARSIIVVSPEKKNPDADVIKTILAILNSPQGRDRPYHIVAEIRDPCNVEAARMVGRNQLEIVLAGSLISRIIAQTCRQSGLSVVHSELLDFGGDEIYFKPEPDLAGRTFGEVLNRYEDSAVIGLAQGGWVKVNPPMDTRLQADCEIIAVSGDDNTIRLSASDAPAIDEDVIRAARPGERRPEKTLILGWNWRAPTVINELDRYVAPGSCVTILADYGRGETDISRSWPGLSNQTVSFQQGNTTDRRTLDALAVETYDHIVVLSYSDALDKQEADAETLITLLHLRDIAERGGHDLAIVSEMLDLRNRELAEVTRADDFIVSDKLISLMLAQVSESKRLNAVLADIFDPEGSEIYLKPAGDYVALGVPVSFFTVVESARRRGEIAFGYRRACDRNNAANAYGIVVNPLKSASVTFTPEDRIIVLAEE